MAKNCLVRDSRLGLINNGPGLAPRKVRYFMMASTGQMAVSVFPKNTCVPLLNRSVFDSFIVIWIRDGADLLSIAKSLKDKWVVGSCCDNPGDVNSLHRRNPKNATQQAAHIIAV